MSMSRSGFAVAMGYLTTVVLVLCSFGLIAAFQPNLLEADSPSIALLWLTLTFGWLAAIPAGYVTARLSGGQEFGHAGLLIVLIILLAWVSWFMEGDVKPAWWHVGLQLGMVPSVLFGAWLRVRSVPQAAWWQFWRR